MGFVSHGGQAKVFGADIKSVEIVKSRDSFSCSCCNTEIAKGSFALGGEVWSRLCLNCADKLFSNIDKALNEYREIMEETKKDLKLNAEKYRAHNVVCSI